MPTVSKKGPWGGPAISATHVYEILVTKMIWLERVYGFVSERGVYGVE